jgi:putative tryptophan/tyrosine transport system substrate-binding protein
MKRRALIRLLGSGLVLWPHITHAQQAHRVPRIGVLWHAGSAEEEGVYYETVRQGFRDLGYVEGQTIILEHRFPNEEPERFRTMAAELAALKPDVLLAASGPSGIAAKNATTTVPVVFILVQDPLGSKLVDSLAAPGGNVTGLSNMAVELSTKRLEFLKEALPHLSSVALLITSINAPIAHRYVEESEVVAPKLGLAIHPVEVQSLGALERAFDAMVEARMQAVVVNPEGLFFQGKTRIAQLALARRLPTCVYSRETLEAGALMSYGPDYRAVYRRAIVYADKILKGAKPGDLPVERPIKFELIVNLKTAEALGLTIAPTLLFQADEVIR